MKASQIANNKWTFIVVFCVLGLWMLAVIFGESLPYLATQSSSDIRVRFVFPLLSVFLVWFVFLHKWSETGATGYQMRMRELKNRSGRVKHTLILVFGLFLLAGFISWTSINFARWAAFVSPSEPFSQAYKVISIGAMSGAKLDIEMIGVSGGKTAWLRLTRSKHAQQDWGVGDKVCAKGKISMFGVIVETVTRYSNTGGC